MQNVWGEENVPENALSRKFLDPSKRASGLLCRGLLYTKNTALTPEGGGKRTVRGGVQNPFLGGVSFVRFSTPLFFSTPPWRSLIYATPPCQACLWIAIGHLYGKKWGCSSDSLRCHRKHSATFFFLLICSWSGLISEICNFLCLEEGPAELHIWLSGELIQKQFYSEIDVRLIGKLFPRQLMRVIGAFTGSTDAPDLHKIIPARKPCVTDALCNWEINFPQNAN